MKHFLHVYVYIRTSFYISVFFPAGWLFGNLSRPLLFGLRHLIAIVFAVLIDIKIESFFTVEMSKSIFCICHTFHLSKYFFYLIFAAIWTALRGACRFGFSEKLGIFPNHLEFPPLAPFFNCLL